MEPALPDLTWWQDMGVLGIIAMIVAGAICTALWTLYFPHARATQKLNLKHLERKQELETQREEKLNVFIDKLAETHSEEVAFKRQMAVAMTDIARNQGGHAADCAASRQAVERIENRIAEVLTKKPHS